MLASAVIVYRSLRWSMDTPVLRRALRTQRFGWFTWAGMAVVVVGAIALLYQLGARSLDPSTLFFAGMLLLFGSLGVMFTSLLLEDVREVFYVITGRVSSPLERWREPKPDRLDTPVLETPPKCGRELTCVESHTPCGSGGVTPARRKSDRRRSSQHR
jgi:hypothetical protein